MQPVSAALDHAYLVVEALDEAEGELAEGLLQQVGGVEALAMIANIRAEGLMTDEEFSSLSDETRQAIDMLLGAR